MSTAPQAEGGRSFVQNAPHVPEVSTQTGIAVSGQGYSASAVGEIGVIALAFVLMAVIVGAIAWRAIAALERRQ